MYSLRLLLLLLTSPIIILLGVLNDVIPFLSFDLFLFTLLPSAVKKRLELAEKYKELRSSGKLEKFLSKKRKRNARRDRRLMPFKRKH